MNRKTYKQRLEIEFVPVSSTSASLDTISNPSGISKKPKLRENEGSVYANHEIWDVLQNSEDEDTIGDEEYSSEEEEEAEEENESGYYIVVPEPSESSGQGPKSHLVWSPTPQSKPQIDFSRHSGMLQFPSSNEPIDYFFHVCTNEIFDLIIKETNRQADILLSQNTKRKARIRGWKPLTREELEVFLGLIFLSGPVDMPTLQHYWQINSLYDFPIFRNAMSRDRFLLILRKLQFAENPKIDGENLKPADLLYKISPLLDMFHERMKEIYYPTKELSIDQSMLLWQDRLYFRHYIQNKRRKIGLKFYTLTQPDGLVLKTRVHCGASDPLLGGSGYVEKMVKHLLDGYFGVGHSVYMDEFYSSVELSNYLLERDTYSTATLRANRKGNPLDIINRKLKKGQVASAYNRTGVCVLKFRDNKRDTIGISSEFGPTINRYKSRTGKMSEKPEAIRKYDEIMCGIDRCEQLLNYYPCNKKTIRWDAKIALHLFHVMMNNAFILYKQQPNKDDTRLLDFRESVISQLIYRNRPVYSAPPPPPKQSVVHVISQVPRNAQKRLIRKRCLVCSKMNKRVETTYFCNDCKEKPGLCMGACFKKYHGYTQSC